MRWKLFLCTYTYIKPPAPPDFFSCPGNRNIYHPSAPAEVLITHTPHNIPNAPTHARSLGDVQMQNTIHRNLRKSLDSLLTPRAWKLESCVDAGGWVPERKWSQCITLQQDPSINRVVPHIIRYCSVNMVTLKNTRMRY